MAAIASGTWGPAHPVVGVTGNDPGASHVRRIDGKAAAPASPRLERRRRSRTTTGDGIRPCFALLAALSAACPRPTTRRPSPASAPSPPARNAPPVVAPCRAEPDRDGDGFLGDAEVASVDYLCAVAPISALFRSDGLTPGAGCASGGVALLVGSDDDGDGFLGDAESSSNLPSATTATRAR